MIYGPYSVEKRSEFCFAVLGKNLDAGKDGVSYSGEHLTICTTDGRAEADQIAAALTAAIKIRPGDSFPQLNGWTVSIADHTSGGGARGYSVIGYRSDNPSRSFIFADGSDEAIVYSLASMNKAADEIVNAKD